MKRSFYLNYKYIHKASDIDVYKNGYFLLTNLSKERTVRDQGAFVSNTDFLLITGVYFAVRVRGEFIHENVLGGTSFVIELFDDQGGSSLTEVGDNALGYVARLLELSQVLFKDGRQAAENLCQIVVLMTQRRVQLTLYPHVISIDPYVKAEPSSSSDPSVAMVAITAWCKSILRYCTRQPPHDLPRRCVLWRRYVVCSCIALKCRL